MFIAAIFVARIWKSKCPSTDEWIHAHTMEYQTPQP